MSPVTLTLPAIVARTLGSDAALAYTPVAPLYPAATPSASAVVVVIGVGLDVDVVDGSRLADLGAGVDAGRRAAGGVGDRHAHPGRDAPEIAAKRLGRQRARQSKP